MKTNLSIYVEYDYSKFKFMPSNRSIKGNNKKLINSISEHDITPYTPILVDKNMQILDGQHRYDACRKLGKPIYYIVYDGDKPPEDVMVCLNTCIRPWRQEEWIQFYYNKGYPVYVKFVEMAKKYDLTISNNILLFSGSKSNSSDVKKGNLKDYSEFYAPIYEFVMSIEHPKKTYRAFIAALLRFFCEYSSDKRSIERLRRKIICVPKFSNIDDYYNSFVNLSK